MDYPLELDEEFNYHPTEDLSEQEEPVPNTQTTPNTQTALQPNSPRISELATVGTAKNTSPESSTPNKKRRHLRGNLGRKKNKTIHTPSDDLTQAADVPAAKRPKQPCPGNLALTAVELTIDAAHIPESLQREEPVVDPEPSTQQTTLTRETATSSPTAPERIISTVAIDPDSPPQGETVTDTEPPKQQDSPTNETATPNTPEPATPTSLGPEVRGFDSRRPDNWNDMSPSKKFKWRKRHER
jgi:hypothetical protein